MRPYCWFCSAGICRAFRTTFTAFQNLTIRCSLFPKLFVYQRSKRKAILVRPADLPEQRRGRDLGLPAERRQPWRPRRRQQDLPSAELPGSQEDAARTRYAARQPRSVGRTASDGTAATGYCMQCAQYDFEPQNENLLHNVSKSHD